MVTVSAQCENLQKLHKELSQETQGSTKYNKETKLLLSLLNHKDKQIKILSCCCLSDILRICAPDAPFTKPQLKLIFSSFFRQLLQIKDSNGPLFSYYFYLLESISTIKSVVLLGDLNADQLVQDVFNDFFEVIKSDMSMAVQVSIRDILYQLVEELPHLQQEVVETIITHMSVKTQKANPAAFKLSCDLGAMTDDKLQRYVCQYFSDGMVESSKDEDDLAEYSRNHDLILQIFEHVPTLLLNVIPQLEEQLNVENIPIREITTTTLGAMFAKRGSKWVESYSSTFKSWCERRNDKSVAIRVIWVEFSGQIVQKHPDMTLMMEDMLMTKLKDPDEKIRSAALEAFGLVCQDHPDLLSDGTLEMIGSRCRDKKASVRSIAIQVLSKLYNQVFKINVQTGDISLDRFSFIPGVIFDLLYLDEFDTNLMVERAIVEELMAPNLDHELRTKRILITMEGLNEKQRNGFISFLNRQSSTIGSFTIFIEQALLYQRDKKNEVLLLQVINFLCKKLPEKEKNEKNLMKIVDLADLRLFKLLKAVMDPTVEYKNVLKHNKEISSLLQPALLDTLTVFLRRISLSLMNKNTMDVLMHLTRDRDNLLNRQADLFLQDISRIFPALYKTQVAYLSGIIVNGEAGEVIADAVVALAKYVKVFPQDGPQDEKVINKLVFLASKGTMKQAKGAATILATMDGLTTHCKEVLELVSVDMEVNLVSKLSCLKAMAAYRNDLYSDYSPKVINFVVSQVLMRNHTAATDDDLDWVPFDELEEEGQAKVIGLKILVKPLLVGSDMTSRLDVTKSVMKLCRALIISEGELIQSHPTPSHFRAHLRLNAGKACLKLLGIPAYYTAFELMDFNKIGLLVQDQAYIVRSAFIDRICSSLDLRAIPIKYAMWLMLAALEPEADLKLKVKSFLLKTAKQQRSQASESKAVLLEQHFADFCHLLSHHPDFSLEREALEQFEKYVAFFLATVATAENISYLYCLANQMKLVKDRHLDDSTPLYVIADMLLQKIREFSAKENWTLQTYPGKIAIPRDLYHKLDDETKSSVLKTVFYKEVEAKGRRNMSTPKKVPAVKRAATSDDESGSDNSAIENNPPRKSTRSRKTKPKIVD